MLNHIMVDLETLSTTSTAAILSIGAVRFDLESGEIGGEFFRAVRIQSCIDLGLTIDGSTLSFWAKQPEPARKVMWWDTAEDLPRVLMTFSEWAIGRSLNNFDTTFLWGNGACFDNAILKNAYRACQLSYPVSYKNDLCYRTVRRLYKMKFPNEELKADKPHDSLQDAKLQVQHLIDMWRLMR